MRDRSELISVPIDRAEVITALRDKAERGDVPAARELREWLDKHARKNRDADFLAFGLGVVLLVE